MSRRGFGIDLYARTYVMGILNVTPDSFFDGGRFFKKARAIARGLEIVSEGADILDIGGESTRPGAADISAASEIDRVMPVIEALAKKIQIPISIDTRKSEVAREALRAGAGIVNDVSGLRHDPHMAEIVAKYKAGLIVMHMKGTPRDMQKRPRYKDLINEIINSLRISIEMAETAGVRRRQIVIDPGIGFGKTVEHNLRILNRLGELKTLGLPICVGVSRKSFLGKILGISDPDKRLAASLAASAIAIIKGANILRAHDVTKTLQVARITDSIRNEVIR